MANLAKDLKKWFEEGEVVEGVVIGKMGWGDYNSGVVPGYSGMPRGVVLSWEEAEKLLDFEYDDGYGAPECPAIYVWTNTSIYFVVQYDGSTSLEIVPRNPIDCTPHMPGGG